MAYDYPTDLPRVSQVYRRHLSSGRARMGEMLGGHVEVESDGAWITTATGGRLLNAAGYGVFLTGARHPTVIAAVEKQLHRHPVGTRLLLEPVAAAAAAMLTAVTPPGLTRVHFSSSGAEATEAAIKLARLNGRTQLISMSGGYHGKTMGALSLTARAAFQRPFRPLLPAAHVPYADTTALAAVLADNPSRACVFVEPVQGEAGVVIPPPGYLAAVRALCSEYGALLVVDEIQTGLGRLGHWWGVDREQIRPDILLSGKGLGGGVIPVAATVATDEVFAVLDRDPVLHTSTFSAAPIAMAAVCGALTAIREDELVTRAASIGETLRTAIEDLIQSYLPHHDCAVRGVGLLIGIDFADPALVGDLVVELITNRVLVNLSLNSEHVLRLTPPAVMSDSDVRFLLDGLERAIATTALRNPGSEARINA